MATIRLQFLRDAGYSPDGIDAVRCEAGEVADVPEGPARSLIEGAVALPVDPDSVGVQFGGERHERADVVLRKHSLTVRAVAGDEAVDDLRERHSDVSSRLNDVLDELQDAKAKAERLREARVEALQEGTDGPDREAVREAKRKVSDLEADAEDLRAALDGVTDRLAAALEEAHRKADSDAKETHEALLRKCIDAARKFRAILDDVRAFEAACSDRIRRRVGDMSGIENWVEDAEKVA